MGKYIKNLALYFIIALILQGGVLYYLNYKYLSGFSSDKKNEIKTTSSTTATNASTSSSSEDKALKFNVPSDATDIEVSKESDKVAYIKDGQINIVTTKGDKKSVDLDGLKLLKFQWLDEGKIIVATSKQNSLKASFYQYDTDSNEKELLSSITLKDKKSSIDSIISSPLKDLIFVRIKSSSGNSEIYKLNVRNEFEKVELKDSRVKDVELIPHEDKLIYNSSINSSVYVTYVDDKISLTKKGLTRILGVDKSENVYVGLVSSENISKVYYGSINDKTSNWKEISLDNPISPEELAVLEDGLYKIDDQGSKATQVGGTNVLQFKGKFLKVYNGKILSTQNDQLYIN